MADRPCIKSILADPDPKKTVATFVSVAGEVNARTASIYRILTSAAASDADAARCSARSLVSANKAKRLVARALAHRQVVAPGVGRA